MGKFLLAYLLARSAEASTWTGLVVFFSGLFGFNLSDHLVTDIISAGSSIGGILAVLLPSIHTERKK